MDSAPLLVFSFRFRDPLTGKWVGARYKASRSKIEKRYAEWEITGPGEVRKRIGGSFSPHGKLIAPDEPKRVSEPPLQCHPHMDEAEVFLVRLFLRRYVTYCARRGRYAQMNGAAELFREIRAVVPLKIDVGRANCAGAVHWLSVIELLRPRAAAPTAGS